MAIHDRIWFWFRLYRSNASSSRTALWRHAERPAGCAQAGCTADAWRAVRMTWQHFVQAQAVEWFPSPKPVNRCGFPNARGASAAEYGFRPANCRTMVALLDINQLSRLLPSTESHTMRVGAADGRHERFVRRRFVTSWIQHRSQRHSR